MTQRALVYGVGVAGLATLKALMSRGYDVVVADDRVTPEKSAVLDGLGCDVIESPESMELRALISTCDFVAPAPGIPETHRLIEECCTSGVPLRSELDLAYEWESNRPGGARPMVTVTGTDGKTTTVLLTEAILTAAGRRTIACGNTEIPLVEALDMDVDSFVVEATSFRLAFVETFRSAASAWLNLAPDHLDWHTSMASYELAKARIWSHVVPSDAAIGYAEDPVVMRHLSGLSCRRFTVGGATGDYRVDGDILMSPVGPIIATGHVYRSLPHDLINALTASALAFESGLADVDAASTALSSFRGPAHRIEFVIEHDGISYYDDSKATTPHAALTAMRGFDSIVLIAGGRNKGLDLSAMGTEMHRIRSVVLIGEASDELSRVFDGRRHVEVVDSMFDAVQQAARLAQEGDVVLLSPGCTSLDMYGGYAERGNDFARCVREMSGRIDVDEMEVAP